tara:strand:+ start:671 stop:1027 length:357 start_codon:yes stop_codon:yes gene_type:complete
MQDQRFVSGWMRKGLISLLIPVIGAAAGCGLGEDKEFQKITYGPHVEKVSERAGRLAEESLRKNDFYELRTAVRLYLAVGNVDDAEKYVYILLEKDPERALDLLSKIGEYREEQAGRE